MQPIKSFIQWTFVTLRWAVISVLLTVAEIVAYIITPIVVLFADRATGKLPPAFWWMETQTEPLPGPTSITGVIAERRGWYVASVYWLWRNSVYALADKFRIDPDFTNARFWYIGNKDCNNTDYQPGVFLGSVQSPTGRAFEFRAVWPMPGNNCGMFRAGWKLSSWFDGRRPQKPTATGMLQVPSLRPFLTRR